MYFERIDTSVELKINSKLGTCRPVYPFTFNTGSQEYAELLTRQMNKIMEEFKHDIATRAWHHLDADEISQLKKELSNWNSREKSWKPQ